MVKNLNAKASVSPATVKNETMKSSEISARARNKTIVNSPFGAVQLKVKRFLCPLDVNIGSLGDVMFSPLYLLQVYYLG